MDLVAVILAQQLHFIILLGIVTATSIKASETVVIDDRSIIENPKCKKSPFSDKSHVNCSSEREFDRHVQRDESCIDSSSFQFISSGDTLKTCEWLSTGSKKQQKRKQKKFCPKMVDGVYISDQCKQSCGLCSTCSYRCFRKSMIASDVCEHEAMCSKCADDKPLHRTCKNLWDKCGDSNHASIYGGLDCSNVKALHQCYMEKIDEDYRETFVKYNWSWVEQPKLEYKPGPKVGRYEWFLDRKPFEPIVNDTTAITGVLYTFSESVLKMSVFFPPLYPKESTKVQVDVVGEESGKIYLEECEILPFIWMCTFRFDNLPMEESYTYIVKYSPKPKSTDIMYEYEGLIPLHVGKPRIAAMSCLGARDTVDADNVVEEVLKSQPDVIALLGDHNYFHHQASYGFLETIYSINKLTKSLPTIVQMDDHDYGLGNIFGAGVDGTYNSGDGFIGSDPCLFKSYEHQVLSHLPDSVSNKTLLNGIKYQYTNLIYGDVDIAILEARKFKNKRDSLLGSDQEQWLQDWCENDDSSTDRTKIVLAQSPFISFATHYRGQNKEKWTTVTDNMKDPNGFPSQARKRALEILRGCTNVVISGDQHVGFAIEYPDYGIMDCATPATYNSVFWRINDNPLDVTHIDTHGNQYILKEVYQMPQEIRAMTPASTLHASPDIYNARGDGFLVVDITDNTVTCEMRGYDYGNAGNGSLNVTKWWTDVDISSATDTATHKKSRERAANHVNLSPGNKDISNASRRGCNDNRERRVADVALESAHEGECDRESMTMQEKDICSKRKLRKISLDSSTVSFTTHESTAEASIAPSKANDKESSSESRGNDSNQVLDASMITLPIKKRKFHMLPSNSTLPTDEIESVEATADLGMQTVSQSQRNSFTVIDEGVLSSCSDYINIETLRAP